MYIMCVCVYPSINAQSPPPPPPLQTCSRILLRAADKRTFLQALRRPTLSVQARKAIAKKINDKCRKLTVCTHCRGLNGEGGKEGGGREGERRVLFLRIWST